MNQIGINQETLAMSPSNRRQSSLQGAALLHIGLGLATMSLAYYVGSFSAILLGLAITSYAAAGLWLNRQLNQYTPNTAEHSRYYFLLAVGLLLTALPNLTLNLAALLLGGSLIIAGVQGLKALRRSSHQTFWGRPGHFAGILLGLLIILSGASGLAWLIGMLFGLHSFCYGIRLWLLSQT